MIRIYQRSPLQVDSIISLDERNTHHVSRVLRVKSGEPITIFNGEGGEYEGVIAEITRKHVLVKLNHFIDRNAESPLEIYLAQGLVRGEKMDFIVQKAVELGVKKIIPIICERSNVRLDAEREEKRLMHWEKVLVSACEQSGRNSLPKIVAPIPLENWLATEKVDYAFVLSPHSSGKLRMESVESGKKIGLLIGPEGGLTQSEIKSAETKGFIPLNLGPRILRTETAPLAALALLQNRFGDMG